MMVHVPGPVPPKWETQMELLAPGFSLTQRWLIVLSGPFSFSPSPTSSLSSLSLFHTNNKSFFKKITKLSTNHNRKIPFILKRTFFTLKKKKDIYSRVSSHNSLFKKKVK